MPLALGQLVGTSWGRFRIAQAVEGLSADTAHVQNEEGPHRRGTGLSGEATGGARVFALQTRQHGPGMASRSDAK